MLLNHALYSIDQPVDQKLVVHAPSTCDVSPLPPPLLFPQSAGLGVNEEIFAVFLATAFRNRNYSFMVCLMKVRTVQVQGSVFLTYVCSMTFTALCIYNNIYCSLLHHI